MVGHIILTAKWQMLFLVNIFEDILLIFTTMISKD
jgi:hypothetical protein